MFKVIVVIFTAFFAITAAYPSYLASSPVVYSPHYVQPVVRSHYALPAVRTALHTPVLHGPVVHSSVLNSHATTLVHHGVSPEHHSVVAPAYHNYGAVSLVSAYGTIKI